MDYQPLKCWAFAWKHGSPTAYITRITGYTRRDCIAETVAQIGIPWRKIYRQGGRMVKCVLTEV